MKNAVYKNYSFYLQLMGSCICAFLGVWALPYILRSADHFAYTTNSILSCLLFGLFGFMIFQALNVAEQNRRRTVFSLILGFLLSAVLVVGSFLYLAEQARLNQFKTYLIILAFTPTAAAAFDFLFRRIEKINKTAYRPFSKKVNYDFLASKKFLFILWGIIVLCWIPVFLAAYPGVYGYDGPYQFRQFDTAIEANHPVVHTLFMGGLTLFGGKYLGSYALGFAISNLIQMLIVSFLFAFIIHYLAKIKAPFYLLVFVFLFLVFNPIHSIYAVSGTKDVLFSGFFALAFLFLFDAARDPERFFHSWKLQLRLFIFLFLSFIFRNNGFYAFIFLIPFFLILFRKYWKRALLFVLICVSMNAIYFGPLHSAFGINGPKTAEALSVPIQQLCRVMRDNQQELTEEEKQWINTLIPANALYEPRISDRPKLSFNAAFFDEDPFGNLKNWIKIGLKCPVTYVDAFLDLNLGYWYPDMIYRDPGAYHPFLEYDMIDEAYLLENGFLNIRRDSHFPALSNMLHFFAYQTPQKQVPVLSMLFSPGFMFWVLLFLISVCLYFKKYQLLIPTIFLFGLFLTLLLAPTVMLRYAYPLFLALPVELGVLLTEFRKKDTSAPENKS